MDANNLYNNAKTAVQSSIPSADAVQAAAANATESIKSTLAGTVEDFSSKNAVSGSSEFLAANGMVAKFLFLLLLLIVFLFALNIGIYLVSYILSPSRSPYIVSGLLPGNNTVVIPQSPGDSNAAVIYRSNNRSSGMEFTWSTWLQVTTVPTVNTGEYNNIFVKGTNVYDNKGLAKVNNGPGLYVSRTEMTGADNASLVTLSFRMNVVSPINGEQKRDVTLDVNNFPVGKWVHVAFRLQNKSLDCYVNGSVTAQTDFGDNIPKQNYDDVIIAGNGGFPGNISNLRYYDYALSIFEINSILYYGPNLNASSLVNNGNNSYDYLGKSWYTNIFTTV